MGTEEKIIEAAYRCFSEKGYLGTKTKEIAENAGISEVTLFRHFKTKAAIFEAVIRNYSILSDLRKVVLEGSRKNLEETLEYIAERIYLTLKEKKRFIKILLSEITSYPGEITKIYDSFFNELDSALLGILKKEKGLQLKENLNLKFAVRGFHCMLFGFFQTNEIFLKREFSREEIKSAVNTFVKMFLDGIRREEKL